jgi:TolB-like protein/Tfp pilus assembly protein PilF
LSRAFEPEQQAAPRARWRLRRWLVAAGAVGGLAIATLAVVPGLRERAWRALLTPSVNNIVVLPLVNLSRDPAQDYFADGVTDILMDRLATIDRLRVVARASIAALPADRRDPATLRTRLGAEYAVEGSVERHGDRLRISARLVQASTGTLLWSDVFERPLGDLYTLQGEIAGLIGSKIIGRLDGEAGKRLRQQQTTSTEAQELFLQGRHLIYRFDRTRVEEARQLLERAVAVDPSYGAAYASLARTYGLLLEYNMATPAEVQPLAIAAASRAVSLSPDLADANVADADMKFRFARDWDGAEMAYRRALALAPHASLVLSPFARFLCASGRLDEALERAEDGAAADPLAGEMISSVAVVHYLRREYDEAIRFHEKALQIAPSYGPAYFGLARAWSGKADYRRAIEFIQKAQAAVGDHAAYRAELARNYALGGWRDLADQMLGGLLVEARQGGATSYEGIGFVYAAFGDRDRAFEWLNRAMDHYFARMLFLKVDPRADPLRDDPRFAALLQRLGLQP